MDTGNVWQLRWQQMRGSQSPMGHHHGLESICNKPENWFLMPTVIEDTYAPPKAEGTPQKKEEKENVRTRRLEAGLCSGRVTAMTSRQLWLLAIGLHRTGPVSLQS